MFSVRLTPKELLLLDGHCRPEIQVEVEVARRSVNLFGKFPDQLSAYLGLIYMGVLIKGVLKFEFKEQDHCVGCGRVGEHPKFLSGPRKGEPNHGKPAPRLQGKGLNSSFLCTSCWDECGSAFHTALQDKEVELPASFMGYEPRFKRYEEMDCRKCAWKGHEGLLVDCGMFKGCPVCRGGSLASYGMNRLRTYVVVPVSSFPIR